MEIANTLLIPLPLNNIIASSLWEHTVSSVTDKTSARHKVESATLKAELQQLKRKQRGSMESPEEYFEKIHDQQNQIER